MKKAEAKKNVTKKKQKPKEKKVRVRKVTSEEIEDGGYAISKYDPNNTVELASKFNIPDSKTILLAWEYEKIRDAQKKESRRARLTGFLMAIGLILGLVVLFFALNGIFNTFNFKAQPIVAPLVMDTQTPTLTETFIPTFTPTPKVAFAPMLKAIENLPWCKFETNIFPCKYMVQPGDTYEAISHLLYGNPAYSARIAELYRNAKGAIPILTTYDILIAPKYDVPLDHDYYSYYFGILNTPIFECNTNTPIFPCWYFSEGLPYDKILAENYSSSIKLSCLQNANRTKYLPTGLVALKPDFGDLVVLPVCP